MTIDKTRLAELREMYSDYRHKWKLGSLYSKATVGDFVGMIDRIDELEAIVGQRNKMCSDYFKRIKKLEARCENLKLQLRDTHNRDSKESSE